jgi:hypothetical protein
MQESRSRGRAVVAALVVIGAAAFGPALGSARPAAAATGTVRTAVADCPLGQVMLGAGGRIVDGHGAVVLSAVVPDQALGSVTVRGEARPGYAGDWMVRATAVCAEVPSGVDVRLVPSGVQPGVATCPAGTRVTGTGFRLPPGGYLTGLVPSADLTRVTVGSGGSASDPVAYAICVTSGGPGTFHVDRHSSGPTWFDGLSPKAIATDDVPVGTVSGAGAEIVGSVPGIFLDAVTPTADLRAAYAHATAPAAAPAAARLAADDPGGSGDAWALVAYDVSAYYY